MQLFQSLFLAAAMVVSPNLQAEESIVGVGMALSRTDAGQFFVESLVPNSPAERSGMIVASDELVTVKADVGSESVAVTGMEMEPVISMIRGEEGTVVELTFGRADRGAPVTVSLVREKLDLGKDTDK